MEEALAELAKDRTLAALAERVRSAGNVDDGAVVQFFREMAPLYSEKQGEEQNTCSHGKTDPLCACSGIA